MATEFCTQCFNGIRNIIVNELGDRPSLCTKCTYFAGFLPIFGFKNGYNEIDYNGRVVYEDHEYMPNTSRRYDKRQGHSYIPVLMIHAPGELECNIRPGKIKGHTDLTFEEDGIYIQMPHMTQKVKCKMIRIPCNTPGRKPRQVVNIQPSPSHFALEYNPPSPYVSFFHPLLIESNHLHFGNELVIIE